MGLTAGTRLGAYEILGAIGAGGMGEVYRARDPRLDRDVAIKVLSAAARERRRRARAIRARSDERRQAVAPEHPVDLRVRPRRRHRVRRHRTGGRRDAARAARAAGRCPRAGPSRYALQIAQGHRRRTRPRPRASRSQARERDDHARRPGQDPRLRPGQVCRSRAAATRRSAPSCATSAGTVLGTFGYMAPEQVRALAGRSSRRHLRVRRGALRDAERRTRVQGRDGRRHDDRDPDEGSAGARHRTAGDSRRRSTASSGAVSRRRRAAIPVGQRPRVRARDALDDLAGVVDRRRRRARRRSVAPGAARALVAAVDDRGAGGRSRRGAVVVPRRPAPATGRALEPVHADHRSSPAKRRRRALSPDGGTVAYAAARERQLGHLHAARRRPQRDADRQRSAARRGRPGVLAGRIAHRVSRIGRRRRHLRRGRDRRIGPAS